MIHFIVIGMFAITTFYKFAPLPLEELDAIKLSIEQIGARLSIRGLILVGVEGINSTVAAAEEAVLEFKQFLEASVYFQRIAFKDSPVAYQPFKRLSVQIREEIVTLGKPEIVPPAAHSTSPDHLSPEQWQKILDTEREDIILLDTRNKYEIELGTFTGALDPKIEEFSDFPEFVRTSGLPRDKKILMFCTGGIRCEKASVEMRSQGFENVYQLDGGILNYLEKLPNRDFQGECFVFDKRVSVDQHLNPSEKYMLCPHCGNPGAEKITCIQCGKQCGICAECSKTGSRNTCSKNCAYHAARKGASRSC